VRDNEFNSYVEDLAELKSRVAGYEAYIKKLKDLVDNDKAEELIDELSSNEDKRNDLIDIKNHIF